MSNPRIADAPEISSEPTSSQLKRRGLFAAAWAAVAGLVLVKTTEPVQAASGMLFQDMAAGGFINNSAGGPTGLFSNSTYTTTSAPFVSYAFQGAATSGICGISGSGSGISPEPCGVYGLQNKVSGASVTSGVLGENSSTTGRGVLGRSGNGTSLKDGVGVQGETAGGFAIYGTIPSSTKNAIAVYGANFSSYTGGAPGAGGFGCYGYSDKGHGLVGATGTAGAAALVGSTNGIAGAYAGAFYGPVVIAGAFVVTGAKSAAVPHEDGTHRLVYCVESPESWLEDFGSGQLKCGGADVTIDPGFAAIADMHDYHVFVTAYDQSSDLVVKKVGDAGQPGFRVQTKDNADGDFSWRVVAKRKDIVGERLAPVTIPAAPLLPEARPDAVLNPSVPGEVTPLRGRTPQG